MNRKKLLFRSVAAVTLLLLLLPLFSFAAAEEGRVIDDAGIFTFSERQQLDAHIASIREQYAFDTVIWTTDTYMSTDRRMLDAAADYYDENAFGAGPYRDGIILMITMDSRNRGWAIVGTGKGTVLEERIPDTVFSGEMREHRYASAMERWLSEVERRLEAGVSMTGHNRDGSLTGGTRTFDEMLGSYLPVAAVIAAVIALIVVLILRGRMKTAKSKRDAADYVVSGSFRLLRRHLPQ